MKGVVHNFTAQKQCSLGSCVAFFSCTCVLKWWPLFFDHFCRPKWKVCNFHLSFTHVCELFSAFCDLLSLVFTVFFPATIVVPGVYSFLSCDYRPWCLQFSFPRLSLSLVFLSVVPLKMMDRLFSVVEISV